MMTPATPQAAKRTGSCPPGLLARLSPPWLLSLLVHLVGVLMLAVLTIGLGTEHGIRLEFALDDAASDAPMFEVAPAPLEDLPEMAPPAALAELALPPAADAPALEMDLGDFLSTSQPSDFDSLAPLDGAALVRAATGQSTSLFGLVGEGSRFVYLFDRSLSMTSVFTLLEGQRVVSAITPLAMAKEELLRSVHDLTEEQEFQIVFYNHATSLFGSGSKRELHHATRSKKRQVTRFVEEMRGVGKTNHWSALQVGMKLKPDAIFIITDAEQKDDLTPAHVQRAVGACKRDGIQVNVIHFGERERYDTTLAQLAAQTGGQHRFFELRALAEMAAGGVY